MIIYVEYQAKNYLQTKKIINQFPNAEIIFIRNYKNILNKTIPFNINLKPSFVIAKLTSDIVDKAPKWYWFNNDLSFVFKTSLNCIFDCEYCFLKWAFKNNIPVYFVNYDDIKTEIKNTIKSKIKRNSKLEYKNRMWFYSSDYSDILWMNSISWFIEEFVPFFEKFNNVMMEIRTKSANIQPILKLWFIPKNTEISFSLNPQELIEKYEKWTSNLKERLDSINILLEKWYNVGLRFLPLLPVKNYKYIYEKFIEHIKNTIQLEKISSVFVSWLLYTKDDYKRILKRKPDLDVLYFLEEEDDNFVRASKNFREYIYKLFLQISKEYYVCLDKKDL